MTKLTAADRKSMPKSEFAGPGKSFPIGDDTHARMAVSGATRSYNAGNISKSIEQKIKAKARAKLGGAEHSETQNFKPKSKPGFHGYQGKR